MAILDWEQEIWIRRRLFVIWSRGYGLREGFLRLGTKNMDWEKVI